MGKKLVTVTQQIDQLEVDKFAWVFLIVHQSVSLISFLKTILRLIRIFIDDKGINSALSVSFFGVDFLLAAHNFVTNTFETILENVSNLIQ